MIELARLEDYGGGGPSIPLERADEIEFNPLDVHEIVEDMFGARRASVTYGDSGSGKTTLMLDLALRMPTGLPWLGKQVEPGAVIYLAAESPQSVRLRLEAYRRHHGVKVGAFAMIPVALNLLGPSADVEGLIELVKIEQRLLKLPVRWLCVDTLARVMPGANENAGEDMSRLVAAIDLLREEIGAHVNLVHHSGKDATKGARGHSSLLAAIDTEIEVTFDPATRLRTLEVTKQRDIGSLGVKLSARFLPIELGTNQWGKPITACVVKQDEPESQHLQALRESTNRRHAEDVVLAGYQRLVDMGLAPSDTRNSGSYLPRQLVDKGLAGGHDLEGLRCAMNHLMTAGRLKHSPEAFRYPNGTKKAGLVVEDLTK